MIMCDKCITFHDTPTLLWCMVPMYHHVKILHCEDGYPTILASPEYCIPDTLIRYPGTALYHVLYSEYINQVS